jgi:hypothetical protein
LTEQQQDFTSLPLSTQIIFAANAGTAKTVIADKNNNARFMVTSLLRNVRPFKS